MPRATAVVVRGGRPGLGRSGTQNRQGARLLTRCLMIIGLGLGAVQAWLSFTGETPTPGPSVVSADSIAGIQITLGQAALALREFGQTGLLSERFHFESGLATVRRNIATLESMATEPAEHQALNRARALLDRVGQLEREHIARTDAGGGAMGAKTLAEIPELRDATAQALTDFREVGVLRLRNATTEPDPVAHLVRGAAGAGAALLALCVGAITLWSRLSPA
jgi:hypothetical protein